MSAKGTLPVVPFPSLLPPYMELGEAGMLEETNVIQQAEREETKNYKASKSCLKAT